MTSRLIQSKGLVNTNPVRLDVGDTDIQRINQMSPTLSGKSKAIAAKLKKNQLISTDELGLPSGSNSGVKIVKITGLDSNYLAVDLEGRVYSFGEK